VPRRWLVPGAEACRDRGRSPARRVAVRSVGALSEVVWATTWRESADRIIGGFFGLRPASLQLNELPRSGTRKLGHVAVFVGERALAWVDDELDEDAAAWAEHRSAPTLLVRTSGTVGLKREHFDQLKLFGEAASAQDGGSQV